MTSPSSRQTLLGPILGLALAALGPMAPAHAQDPTLPTRAQVLEVPMDLVDGSDIIFAPQGPGTFPAPGPFQGPLPGQVPLPTQGPFPGQVPVPPMPFPPPVAQVPPFYPVPPFLPPNQGPLPVPPLPPGPSWKPYPPPPPVLLPFPPPRVKVYEVVCGDTLGEIIVRELFPHLRRAGLRPLPPLWGPGGLVNEVARANGIANPNLIHPGDRIHLLLPPPRPVMVD